MSPLLPDLYRLECLPPASTACRYDVRYGVFARSSKSSKFTMIFMSQELEIGNTGQDQRIVVKDFYKSQILEQEIDSK